MKRRIVATLLVAVALTACATAAPPPIAPAPTWSVAGGFHFGTPAKFSVGIGVGRVLSREIGRWIGCTTRDVISGVHTAKRGCATATDSIWDARWHSDRDLFVIAEPGIKGSRLSLGYAIEHADRSSLDVTSLRASLYRRWNSDHADPGGRYIGVEGAVMGMADIALGLRAGFFTRIAGPTGGTKRLFTLDFPIGY